MKNRYIFLAISLFGMVILLWLFTHKSQSDSSQTPATDLLLDQQQSAASKTIPPRPQSPQIQLRSIPVPKQDVPDAVSEYVRKTIADHQYDWKQPINFYGKVVDENNQAVEGASVDFTWTDLSPNGTSQYHTTSDSSGLFSMLNQKGKRLSVTVSKLGYYSAADARLVSFEYANPADGLFTPDPVNPVIFHLRKKGEAEPLIVMRGGMNLPGVGKKFMLPANGGPVDIDLLKGKNVDIGGQVEVQCWVTNEAGKFNEPYNWKYKISIPGGGVALATNEFNFEAPAEGYQPDMEIQVRPDLEAHWSNKSEQKFFMRLGDGMYGLMKFTIYTGQDSFCLIESFVNPSGSRNLELNPAKIIVAQ